MKLRRKFPLLWQNRKKADRVIATLLMFIMLLTLLSGCGNATETDSENSDGNEQNTQTSETGTAMGRYVEEVANSSDKILGEELLQLADGNLVISGAYAPLYLSKDNGVSWEEDNSARGSRIWDNKTWVYDIAVGADGTLAIICQIGHEEEELERNVCLIKPDGTEVLIDVSVAEGDDNELSRVFIADTGRIFVSTYSYIYEIWEDGNSEEFLALDPGCHPILIQCQENLMVIDGGYQTALLIYDMEKKEYIEDKVLENFVKGNYYDRNSSNKEYDMFFFFDEERILYLAGKEGLHRHVIGGSVIEQVIDGRLATFSDPSNRVCGMVKLNNNEFVTLFSDAGPIRYVYASDIPTVPDKKLKIYGLQENDTIRQAITLYQTANPEILVEYEIGMDDSSSVTRDDVLKKLNTKIMAGEGPDVLLLDNMPLDSYIEKGLLLDMSPILYNLGGENVLFTNITDAMKTGDKIYAMPLEIQVPFIYGDEKYISRTDNLESIADIIEELRLENPEQDLFDVFTERGIMYLFSMVSTPAWTTENGEIDMEAIAEFLKQTKRIYDAQMDGPEKEPGWYHIGHSLDGQEGAITERSADVLSYFLGDFHIVFGTVYTSSGYVEIDSVSRMKNFENCEWSPMNGQSSNVFLAETIVGINAASASMEWAEEFIRLCFSKDNQSNLFNGYAVNQAAFDEGFLYDGNSYDDGGCGMIRVNNKEGVPVDLYLYWPNQEQIAKMRNYIETVDTPYIEDTLLEEAVYEAGIDYLQGNTSLEEAISEIEKKVSIIMAE